jgi:DNA primase
MLWDSLDGEGARSHLAARAVRRDTARGFRLGYAPGSWDALCRYLSRKRVSPSAIESAGLGIKSQHTDGHFDRFRDRLMIPIQVDGQTVAFGGRLLSEGQEPKYLNSPSSPIYRKSSILFALEKAAPTFWQGANAIAVEGYFDAISLHQAGIRGSVGLCGTSLTVDHLRKLADAGARGIVLLLDGDAAGLSSAERTAREVLASKLPVWIAGCPKGLDPDQLLQTRGKEELIRCVQGSREPADFLLDRTADLVSSTRSPELQAQAIQQLSDLFRSVSYRLRPGQAQRFAQRCGFSLSTIAPHFLQWNDGKKTA